ncbi:hypothetical protein ACFLYJ_03945, partial [Candidatus Cloacimonadota bacterium]
MVNIDLPTDADQLQANSISVSAGCDIVYVKLNGGICNTMYGQIIDTGEQDFDVYSWFPHESDTANSLVTNGNNWFEETNLVYQNHLTILDTIWFTGPSLSLDGNSFWVEDEELWIEGNVEGNTTWGCANNVYIVGDITYANTVPGEDPADPVNPNLTDYFGLVSEQSIIIKYKHKDPFNDFELRNDNCNDVMIYGALAAIGFGDESIYGNMACHHDGLFTYEYQHPHGATPNYWAMSPYTLDDTLYTYIDFHKFIFPVDTLVSPEITGFNMHSNDPVSNTSGFPYESPEYLNSYPNNIPSNYFFPYGTDYPWYNPVWPEPTTYFAFERGDVKLWGSLIQRRRGFMRRSGSDQYNHPYENSNYTNVWDLQNYHYGGEHQPTGYYRDYNYDARFFDNPPVNFPTGVMGVFNPTLVIAKSDDECETFQTLLTSSLTDYELINDIHAKDDLIAVTTSRNDSLRLFYSINQGENFVDLNLELSTGEYKKMLIENDLFYFLTTNTDALEYNYIDVFNPEAALWSLYQSFHPPRNMSNFSITDNQKKMYVFSHNHPTLIDIEFRYTEDTGSNFNQIYVWYTNLNFSSIINHEGSDVSLDFDYQDYVYVTIEDAYSGKCNLWFSAGS